MEQSFLPETGENEYLKSDLPEEDFTTTIWGYVGIYYEEEKESHQYIKELIELGLLAWNYSIIHDEELKQYIYLHFQHLCDTPMNEVLSILEKRKKAFYNEDKRIFEFYRIDWYSDDDFSVYVKFSN